MLSLLSNYDITYRIMEAGGQIPLPLAKSKRAIYFFKKYFERLNRHFFSNEIIISRLSYIGLDSLLSETNNELKIVRLIKFLFGKPDATTALQTIEKIDIAIRWKVIARNQCILFQWMAVVTLGFGSWQVQPLNISLERHLSTDPFFNTSDLEVNKQRRIAARANGELLQIFPNVTNINLIHILSMDFLNQSVDEMFTLWMQSKERISGWSDRLTFRNYDEITFLHPALRFLNIRELNCINCRNLRELPDFSNWTNLTKLVFEDCVSLNILGNSLPPAIKDVSFKGCVAIDSLPEHFFPNPTHLRIDLSGCSQLKSLPKMNREPRRQNHANTAVLPGIDLTGTNILSAPGWEFLALGGDLNRDWYYSTTGKLYPFTENVLFKGNDWRLTLCKPYSQVFYSVDPATLPLVLRTLIGRVIMYLLFTLLTLGLSNLSAFFLYQHPPNQTAVIN